MYVIFDLVDAILERMILNLVYMVFYYYPMIYACLAYVKNESYR